MKPSTLLAFLAASLLPLAAACGDAEEEPFNGPTPAFPEVLTPGPPGAAGGPATGPNGDPAPVTAYQPGQERLIVTAYGEASVPVERAVLRLVLVLDPGFDPATTTPCPPDQPCPQPSLRHPPAAAPIADEDIAPVLDAILRQGIAESDIVTIMRRSEGSQGAEIYVVLDELHRLDAIAPAVEAVARDSERVALLGGPAVAKFITEEGCELLREQARDAALADARRRAELTLSGLNVSLGEVISIEEMTSDWPCSVYRLASEPDLDRLPLQSYEPGRALEERAYSNLRVTFAIR